MCDLRRHPCRGLALTELLIAVVLLTIGLLGNVALLVAGLQAERDAANLATAATLTADLAERIRANQKAGLAYAINPDAAAAPLPPICTLAASFAADARAACDLAEWQQEVTDALPGAHVRLTATPVPGAAALLYTITIRWVARGEATGGHYSLRLQV
jgi:type IV pilus assembly protein PilV